MATATRGLATVALLKVFLDKGQDHIGMFMPFIVDSIGTLSKEDFTTADLRAAVVSRHGLDIPADPLKTLLGRASKQGLIKRAAGRYFRTPAALDTQDLVVARGIIEQEHVAVAS